MIRNFASKLMLFIIIMLIAFCIVVHAEEIKQGIQKLPQISQDDSRMTSDQFTYGLLGNLKNVSGSILAYSIEYDIDPILVASIAALESGWDSSPVAERYNNLFGWTNNDGTYKVFETKDECIEFVCKQIKENYLTPNGKYFEGYEIAYICVHYNGSEEWTKAVIEIYEQITNRVNEYKYYKMVNISNKGLQSNMVCI